MPLNEFVLANETLIRVSTFVLVFVFVGVWEVLVPRRKLHFAKWFRWANNLGLVALNTLLLRLVFPAAIIGVAVYSSEQGWGLFNLVTVPYWLAVPLAVVIMDFVIWLQHVMFHAIPLLWRLHRMHHADPDYDLTTGARFHPIEIFLSFGIKVIAVTLFGPPVVAVVLFEVLLNATAMFNHGNLRLSPRTDAALRWFLVTPDMHRVHHSIETDEANSNFGFCLPWWDRLLGTYRDQPRAGHESMIIGIQGFRDPQEVSSIKSMLLMPFRERRDGYTINSRRWLGSNTHEENGEP